MPWSLAYKGAEVGKFSIMAEQHTQDEVDPAEVRRALDSILASEMFRGSPQLAVFLRFIVEATLRGESNRIKGYTIGVEALGRNESFDPQIDPIVRVEATRLRRTLDRYYAGPGIDDPIVIGLSRGSYIPTIRRRQENPGPALADTPVAWRHRLPKSAILTGLAVLAVVAIVFGAISLNRYLDRSGRVETAAGPDSGGQTFSGPLRPGNGMPTLLIEPVLISQNPRTPVVSAKTMVEKLHAAFARFDTINVAVDSTGEALAPDTTPGSSKPEATADYQLFGSGEIQDDGTVTGRFRLVDVAERTVVWSRSFERLPPTEDYGAVGNSVVRQLAMTLLPPFGVIRANERRRHLATGAGDPRYRCVVEASESFRSFDPAQHGRARACLELLTARDPSFAMGFAYLAGIYTREFQYGLGAPPDDTTALDRGLRAARQAIELSPESARAYQMLFTVLFARREIAAAFAAGDKAMALNPYDMTILSDYGGRLILIGEFDRGMDVLTRAAEDGAVRPSWYHFYLFLGSYLKYDMDNASRHASQITSGTYPLGLLAHTLIAVADGDASLARRTYERLIALRPGWRDRPRDELRRHFPTLPVIDRITGDLVKAGLVSAP